MLTKSSAILPAVLKTIPKTRVNLVKASEIQLTPIRWIWPRFLAKGKFHILAGTPNSGKTSIAMSIAATITTGGKFPDGESTDPGTVLIVNQEDSPEDTLKPRLIAAGANLEKIVFPKGVTHSDDDKTKSFFLADHLTALCETIRDLKPSLVVLDPIVTAIKGELNAANDVRQSLAPLIEAAEVTEAAVIGVTHLSKGTQGKDPLERVLGSGAFGALARVVLIAAKTPGRGDRSENQSGIFVNAKNNLSTDGGGLRYTLLPAQVVDDGTSAVHIEWGEAVTGDALSLVTERELFNERTSKCEDAKEFLVDVLAQGPVRQYDIQQQAASAGIAASTLRRAKKQLGLETRKGGFNEGWLWSLPGEDDQFLRRCST